MVALAALALAAALELPAEARNALNRDYPNWRLAPSAPQVSEWMHQQQFGQEPSLAAADLDSDGKLDYAVQIVAAGRQIAIVLLARGATYEKHILTTDSPDPYVYLLVNRRGSREFDFTTLRWVRHQRDSLLVMYFDRTPVLFTWRNAHFERSLALNDE